MLPSICPAGVVRMIVTERASCVVGIWVIYDVGYSCRCYGMILCRCRSPILGRVEYSFIAAAVAGVADMCRGGLCLIEATMGISRAPERMGSGATYLDGYGEGLGR